MQRSAPVGLGCRDAAGDAWMNLEKSFTEHTNTMWHHVGHDCSVPNLVLSRGLEAMEH